MKVWYDTEFLEEGYGNPLHLISIGLVAEDGREYYAVNNEVGINPLNSKIAGHGWLMLNVVSSLPLLEKNAYNFWLDFEHPDVKSRLSIRNEVDAFLMDTPDLELWAWYGAYDHLMLAQLYGRMIDMPAYVPMYTNDLRQEMFRLGDPPIPEQKTGNHNALEDARHLRKVDEALRTPVKIIYGDDIPIYGGE